jgi:hypothetical protein
MAAVFWAGFRRNPMNERELRSMVAGLDRAARELLVVAAVLIDSALLPRNDDGTVNAITSEGEEVARYLIATGKYDDLVARITEQIKDETIVH